MNLYDFIAIILWVIIITCIITLAISFRKEIKILLFRFCVVTGIYSKWRKFTGQGDDPNLANGDEAKVNYEIYNPQTGQIDD